MSCWNYMDLHQLYRTETSKGDRILVVLMMMILVPPPPALNSACMYHFLQKDLLLIFVLLKYSDRYTE